MGKIGFFIEQWRCACPRRATHAGAAASLAMGRLKDSREAVAWGETLERRSPTGHDGNCAVDGSDQCAARRPRDPRDLTDGSEERMY